MSMMAKGSREIPAETVRVARAAFPRGSLAIRVLSEFRDRLVAADAGRRMLDGILVAAREKGLLKTAGRARTDSTHVLSAARELCRLELVAETLRAALNALAQAAPDWLVGVAEPDWFRHYATRAEDSRFPKARAKRDEVGLRIGRDGMRLLQAVFAPDAPREVPALPQVEVLRQVWVQQFHLIEGEVARRDPKDRPPGAMRLVTPHDVEARGSVKRDTFWDGYKVHLTETCEEGVPNLITNVATTLATVPDDRMAAVVHAAPATRDCLPGEHWVDSGYATAAQIVAARADHGLALHGPVLGNTSAQAGSTNGYGQDAFTIDWDRKQVTCPGGHASMTWNDRLSQQGLPVIRVRFSATDCRPCPARDERINSPAAPRRELRLRRHDEHHALREARTEQQTDEWKNRYKIRAGVEGTISQGVHRCDLRRSRYKGLAKTSLQHQLTGAAINLARIDAHLTDTPRARTRTSHFAALRPADQPANGAKQQGPN
ncbi:transposase [Kitasatospora sp. NPDC008050]|uniref:transposase n=1 Tax=Kitasatospora sp. NPDC008050 TaxID=3364021 RepID=UPI0036E97130